MAHDGVKSSCQSLHNTRRNEICLYITGVYFVPNYFGLYSVKVISTDTSVQRLRNKKLNKTKWSGVVWPVKSLNFISNNGVLGSVVHSVVIIVA